MAGAPVQRTEERRERRGVGALLNTYYAIESSSDGGGDRAGASASRPITGEDLDRQGFDARRYFDGVVGSGQLPDLVKRTEHLNAEVQQLDGEMQELVYESYSQFIRATDVIRHVKFAIEGLSPDLKDLEGSIARASDWQEIAERGVSVRQRQMEELMKQQKVCRKVEVLLALPAALERCLERGSYAEAVEAYRSCASFLRENKATPTFGRILEEADVHIGLVRERLKDQLRQSDLLVSSAAQAAATLLDLGEDFGQVACDYLGGRGAMLHESCEQCFLPQVLTQTAPLLDSIGEEVRDPQGKLSKEHQLAHLPESIEFRNACTCVNETFIPRLCDTVEGLQRLAESKPRRSDVATEEDNLLPDFVERHVEELYQQISRMVERNSPPTRVLVACMQDILDGVQRLSTPFPRLAKLLASFCRRVATGAATVVFSDAASQLVSSLCRLHAECTQLERDNSCDLDELLQQIARTEQTLIMCSFTAVSDCQPLFGLLGSDRPACQLFVQGLHSQLITLFLAFVEACNRFVRRDPLEASYDLDTSVPVMPTVAAAELAEAAALPWSGLFVLALVRIGRHFEVQVISRVWEVAKDLLGGGSIAASVLVPHPGVIKATRMAAQALITQYALMNGQQLAEALGQSMRSFNWGAHREPREPRAVIEAVLKDAQALDAQLARVLADPHKPREANHKHNTLNRFRNSMELEMERLWAKKLQIFARVPFNRNGATLGILRITLKAFYEYVREETFSGPGLQQLQVDCACLLDGARELLEAEDAGVLGSLLDEAVASASQRCPEPVLLDVARVEAICDEFKKRNQKL
eukprot:CAMPEP_0172823776 /NCGR_PEP_ID=MMETSP1075-20121228/17557_1 /TAXON_ID=2916 /ORGANISM="Ceratium fusus, Strain PA161109" /LENGTH=813 /DNA_ID=CAMNT_0013664951 /DNA_START=84 /DNA_END=2522 /DNA_ORIENTATION=-